MYDGVTCVSSHVDGSSIIKIGAFSVPSSIVRSMMYEPLQEVGDDTEEHSPDSRRSEPPTRPTSAGELAAELAS
jgi:hypothetical protein